MSRDRREGRASSWSTRATPTRRLGLMMIPLATCIAAIGTGHAIDAQDKGESLWPVALGLGLVVILLGGVFSFAMRPAAGLDPAQAMKMRSHQVIKWTAPLAAALAIVAAIGTAVCSPQ